MYWSWILSGLSVVGYFVAGRGQWWGWAFTLGCQALWAVFAVATAQYGFLVGVGFVSPVAFRNMLLWFKNGGPPRPPCPTCAAPAPRGATVDVPS